MSVHYNGDELFSIAGDKGSFLSGYLPELQQLVYTAETGSKTAFMSDSWKGKAATKFQSYFSDIYGAILFTLFNDLFQRMYERMSSYTGGYINNIDSDTHAVIDSRELDRFQQVIAPLASATKNAHGTVTTNLQNVRHIVSIRYDDTTVPGNLSKIVKEVNTLLSDIDKFEKTYVGEFGEIDGLIKSIRETINKAKTVVASADGKDIAYNPSDFQALFKNAYDAYEANQKYLSTNAERIESDKTAATAVVEKREKELEERKWIAFGLKVVVAVAAVAVTVATAGAAAPVVVAIGAGVGAASGLANSVIDQAVVGDLSGGFSMDKVDWGEAGKEALIGGITGAVSAGFGAGTKAITGTFKNAAPVAKFLGNVAVKGGMKVAEKQVNHMIEGTIRGGSLEAGFECVKENFGTDVAGEFTGAFLGESFGAVTEHFAGKHNIPDLDGYMKKHMGQKVARDLLENEIKDTGKDFVTGTVEGGSVVDGFSKALDPTRRIQTAAESVTETGVGAATEKIHGSRYRYEQMYDEKTAAGNQPEPSKTAYVNRAKARYPDATPDSTDPRVGYVAKPAGKRVGSAVEGLFEHTEDPDGYVQEGTADRLQQLAGK